MNTLSTIAATTPRLLLRWLQDYSDRQLDTPTGRILHLSGLDLRAGDTEVTGRLECWCSELVAPAPAPEGYVATAEAVTTWDTIGDFTLLALTPGRTRLTLEWRSEHADLVTALLVALRHDFPEVVVARAEPESVDESRKPRVPKRASDWLRWQHVWRRTQAMATKGYTFERMAAQYNKTAGPQDGAVSPELMADIVRAGLAGLLDRDLER